MRETSDAIDNAAITFVAQLDRLDLAPDQLPELQAWLRDDPRRQGAFFRALAAWEQLGRVRALSAQDPLEDISLAPLTLSTTSASSRRSRFNAQRRWFFGIAASAAAVVGVVGLDRYKRFDARQVSTARGEVRRLPLEDGSLLTVNTQSQLDVDVSGDLRHLRLEQGEAWVNVAPDAERPFIVTSGDIRVRAIGTAFSVRRFSSGSEVLVTEGTVEVWSVKAPERAIRMTQGERTVILARTGTAPVEKAPQQIQRKLAWREGEIVLDGETLYEAVAEFNRYNTTQIQIDDPELASMKWIGRFRTNEPQAFARAVSVATDKPAYIDSQRIRIGSLPNSKLANKENI